MQVEQSYSVKIVDNQERTQAGTVRVMKWEKPARVKRASKFFFICFGLCILSVFLPLAHFVLVPALFLAAPIGAYILLKQESVVLGGQGVCPSCKNEFKIERSTNRWPLSDMCSHCRAAVSIHKA